MRRGFTLVEVLVALLIMAVIAAMGWQGVSGMARARDIGATASERTLRLTAVIGQWEQDLAAVYDSPLVPGVSFDGAALRLVRRSEGGVQVVAWQLREGRWQRWAGPVVQRAGDLQQSFKASQQLQGPEVGQLQLLDGITGWQIYFWRGQGWSNAQSTGDLVAAPSPAPPAAPASAASGPDSGASAAARAAVNAPRTQLPAGVRLQLNLPEGTLLRDVMLATGA
jgi:general secretion pathway protein J